MALSWLHLPYAAAVPCSCADCSSRQVEAPVVPCLQVRLQHAPLSIVWSLKCGHGVHACVCVQISSRREREFAWDVKRANVSCSGTAHAYGTDRAFGRTGHSVPQAAHVPGPLSLHLTMSLP